MDKGLDKEEGRKDKEERKDIDVRNEVMDRKKETAFKEEEMGKQEYKEVRKEAEAEVRIASGRREVKEVEFTREGEVGEKDKVEGKEAEVRMGVLGRKVGKETEAKTEMAETEEGHEDRNETEIGKEVMGMMKDSKMKDKEASKSMMRENMGKKEKKVKILIEMVEQEEKEEKKEREIWTEAMENEKDKERKGVQEIKIKVKGGKEEEMQTEEVSIEVMERQGDKEVEIQVGQVSIVVGKKNEIKNEESSTEMTSARLHDESAENEKCKMEAKEQLTKNERQFVASLFRQLAKEKNTQLEIMDLRQFLLEDFFDELHEDVRRDVMPELDGSSDEFLHEKREIQFFTSGKIEEVMLQKMEELVFQKLDDTMAYCGEHVLLVDSDECENDITIDGVKEVLSWVVEGIKTGEIKKRLERWLDGIQTSDLYDIVQERTKILRLEEVKEEVMLKFHGSRFDRFAEDRLILLIEAKIQATEWARLGVLTKVKGLRLREVLDIMYETILQLMVEELEELDIEELKVWVKKLISDLKVEEIIRLWICEMTVNFTLYGVKDIMIGNLTEHTINEAKELVVKKITGLVETKAGESKNWKKLMKEMFKDVIMGIVREKKEEDAQILRKALKIQILLNLSGDITEYAVW